MTYRFTIIFSNIYCGTFWFTYKMSVFSCILDHLGGRIKQQPLRSEGLRHSRRPTWEGLREWINDVNQLKCHWPLFDLSMSSKVKFYQVNRKAIYDLLPGICISYMYFIQTLIIRCTVSEILAEIDHKGPNWTFLTLKITFRVIPYHSYFRTWLISQQRSYRM